MQPVQENSEMLRDIDFGAYVQKHEGLSLMPYYCTANKLSIGIGRNLEDRGISREEALFMFSNDINLAFSDLNRVFGADFNGFPDKAKLAFVDMMFQLGLGRFSGFKNMIKYAIAGNWKEAARELMDSKYARQVTKRAEENRDLLLSV